MPAMQELQKETLLVVDDKSANLKLVQRALSKDYIVMTAVSGRAALELIENNTPDLILLDIMMPEMDGYEVCRILKGDEMTKDIPIIFLTAITDMRDEAKGLALGAADYITKPINLPVLLARVKTQLDLISAQTDLANQNEILLHEQELVENIVLRMRSDTRFFAEKMKCLISPLERTNGDIFLSSKTPAGTQYILIGDFTGHGLTAAIAGPLVSSVFYVMSQSGFPLLTIAEQLNQELCAKLPPNIFMAAILISRNMVTGRLQIWNCGMQDVLYIHNDLIEERFSSNSFALGVIPKLDLAKEVMHLVIEPGDHVIAYSDGIVEATSEQGDMFGPERFEQRLTHMLQNKMPLESIIEILTEFTGSKGVTDDVTLIDLQS